MEKSLFHKETPEDRSPTPHELIEPEIVHLKKGYAVRYGPKAKKRTPPWLVILALCVLTGLYIMDPVYHAWYKGEAAKTYLYLRNYGSGPLADNLIATKIFTEEEVDNLNHRQGSFQDYYESPAAANHQADVIIKYMNDVKLLHAGKYETLDPVGRLRYAIFIYPGLVLPEQWGFLDPSVGE